MLKQNTVKNIINMCLKNQMQGKKTKAMFYTIREIIENVLFPLGDFESKDQIRKIAEEHGLLTAKKPDSQEICFIPDDDYAKFLINKGKLKSEPGQIVNKEGNVLRNT